MRKYKEAGGHRRAQSRYFSKNRDEINAKARAWAKANREQVRKYALIARLRTKYKLTLDAYVALLQSQNNKCAICLSPLMLQGKNTHVDHDHKTGRVRGVLCRACNTGLGLAKENLSTIENMGLYLKKHNEFNR